MNHWQYEQYKQIDEFYRQRVLAGLRTHKLVWKYRIYHPGSIERTMLKLANWMISKGKQIRRRYEMPSSNCSRTASDNLI